MASKRNRLNAWDFPHELDRSELDQFILTIDELLELVDEHGKLSSADAWRFIGIHGLDPDVKPRINKVRAFYLCVLWVC